jgi:molecular chaperone DnaK
VLQGEREFARDNRLLGQFELRDIPPAPRGMPQIEVTFNIDVNGILAVTAKDLGTGKEISHRIEKTGGLSKEEIEKMKRDAEMHAGEDKKRREVIDLKNRGESIAYQTEKSLKDYGDKVTPEVRSDIERALGELRDALKTDDGDVISKKMELLTTASHKLAEEMYKAQGAPGGAGAGAGVPPEAQADRGTAGAGAGGGGEGKKKDDDVIDAEYEVKE